MTGGIQTFADNRQTYKDYINDITEILLKVALKTFR